MRLLRALFMLALLLPASAAAQVIITEVMFDLAEGSDSGREWVEVYNASAAAINLSKWKIIESGKNHKITAARGNFEAGTYAIIADNPAKFNIDHPTYTGALFDSAFSLSNSGETIALHDTKGLIASVVYTDTDGGNGTGDSLQKISLAAGALWAPGIPTPGAGIPEGGLVKTPQAEKKTKKNLPKTAAAAPVQPMVSEDSSDTQKPQKAQVAMTIVPESGNGLLWILGVAAIASCGAFGISYARHVRKSEWEIIEES